MVRISEITYAAARHLLVGSIVALFFGGTQPMWAQDTPASQHRAIECNARNANPDAGTTRDRLNQDAVSDARFVWSHIQEMAGVPDAKQGMLGTPSMLDDDAQAQMEDYAAYSVEMKLAVQHENELRQTKDSLVALNGLTLVKLECRKGMTAATEKMRSIAREKRAYTANASALLTQPEVDR